MQRENSTVMVRERRGEGDGIFQLPIQEKYEEIARISMVTLVGGGGTSGFVLLGKKREGNGMHTITPFPYPAKEKRQSVSARTEEKKSEGKGPDL